MLTRRSLLGGASAAGLALVGGSKVWAQTASAPLSAVITINGRTYTHSETTGQDLGDFSSDIGGFTQRCIRSYAWGSPFTVFFRPDRGSDRAEVVFELGSVFGAVTYGLGAYSVSIYRGGTLLTTINVAEHHLYSRWRWQSAARPICGDVDTLISQGLLPPYNRTVGAASTSPERSLANVMTTFKPALIMGTADLAAYMPMTGERDDIGLVTEAQAQYICTGASTPLNALRAQAEAGGTMPWHLRDEITGAPVNFRTHPNLQWYGSWIANYLPPTNSPVTLDVAHMPALAYVPYLLTGDPYHLEDLQFQTNWCWGAHPPGYRPSISQSRAFAWYLRSLAQCARVTPAAAPSWLLPQSYWMGFLQQNRAYLETNYVNSADPVRAIFRSTGDLNVGRDEPQAPGGTWVDPWQEEFVASVIGWVVSMGFSDWRTCFDWKIGSTIARTGTSSGWVRARATPYRMILRSSPSSSVARSWSEAWALSQQVAKLTYSSPDTWVEDDMTYLHYTRGALAFASKLGVAGVSENLAWATGQLVSRGWKTPYKWRLSAGI